MLNRVFNRNTSKQVNIITYELKYAVKYAQNLSGREAWL